MIETLFQFQKYRQLQRQTPLLAERESYLTDMLDHGVSLREVRRTASMLVHLVRLMKLETMRTVEVDEIVRAAGRWVEDPNTHQTRKPGPTSEVVFVRLALKWFHFHGAVDCASTLRNAQIDAFFAEYIQVLRCKHAPKTVAADQYELARFSGWLERHGKHLSAITVLDVDEYLDTGRQAGWTLSTSARQCGILRAFFRYAGLRGWTASGIASGIPRPKVPRCKRVPQGPRWNDVQRLLAANQGKTPHETRTKAMLHLCAIYALRACEVERITIDDFDWINEIFTVRRGKNGRIQQFPLHFDVGQAVIDYLRYGRPQCRCRSLFVTERPPYHYLSSQTIRHTIQDQMKMLGIESEKTGPHSLRHACATRLLQKGSSLSEIADFLGHRGTKSVSIYAKYDVRTLFKVAKFSLSGIR